MIETNTAGEQDHRTSRADAKAATRGKLLEAAREVFLAVGYQGATLDSIASKAGFTKGAVYWHFPNKQALFLALVAASIDDNLHQLESMVEQLAGDPVSLQETLSQWIDGIDERETLPIFGVELEIEARRDPIFRALHQSLIGKHEAALGDFLRHYFAAVGGTPTMAIDELSSTLITLFKGFALIRQNRPDLDVTSAKAVKILIGLPPQG
jgi:AcrR family transcriptional regulator